MIEPALEEDRELLDGFRRGDREALGRVFRRYAREVACVLQRGARVQVDGVVHRVGGDLDSWDLENLLQETFVKAFQPNARASYDGVRPFGAWLMTIAGNVLIDRARKQRREAAHVTFVDDIESIAHGSDDQSAPVLLATRQLSSVLRRFIAGLSDDDRRLFAKRYEEQRSLRQAASELKIGLFELRKRDARLRVALLDTLRSEGLMNGVEVRIGKSVLHRGAGHREREGA